MPATSVNTDPKSPDYSVPLKIEGRNFRLVAATKTDAPVFADVFWDSFQEDAVFRAMNGTADPEKVVESSKKTWTEGWNANGNAWFKVVDDDNGGNIAAIAKWGFPHTPDANPPPPPPIVNIPGENTAIKEDFFKQLIDNRIKNWDKENMYFMNILAVRKQYQRLGLGRQLLAPVLKMADQEGKKAYIEASVAGKPLYEKFGWRRIDDVDVDLSAAKGFENHGLHRTVLMIREPGTGGPGL